MDSCFEMRFLRADEVRGFALNPANGMDPAFAARVEGGLDLCFAAIHGDRLANYAWYALHSIEAEHAAGAALGLPGDMAYLYKAFTHPDFRGQRLNGACTGRALGALSGRGISRLLAFVYWSNKPSLASFDHVGFRRLGLMAVGSRGPARVPPRALRLGVRFGEDAAAALRGRGQIEHAVPASA
jgi:ribosomal protein S18 acetylase RimI-like enzyme